MLQAIELPNIVSFIFESIDNKTAQRIDSACFRDGNEDEFVVEFWHLHGRIVRTCQNRRDTTHSVQFVARGCWEESHLKAIATAQHYSI